LCDHRITFCLRQPWRCSAAGGRVGREGKLTHLGRVASDWFPFLGRVGREGKLTSHYLRRVASAPGSCPTSDAMISRATTWSSRSTSSPTARTQTGCTLAARINSPACRALVLTVKAKVAPRWFGSTPHRLHRSQTEAFRQHRSQVRLVRLSVFPRPHGRRGTLHGFKSPWARGILSRPRKG